MALDSLFREFPKQISQGEMGGEQFDLVSSYPYLYGSGEEIFSGHAFIFRPTEDDRKHVVSVHMDPDRMDPHGQIRQYELDTESGTLTDVKDPDREIEDEDKELLTTVIEAGRDSLIQAKESRALRRRTIRERAMATVAVFSCTVSIGYGVNRLWDYLHAQDTANQGQVIPDPFANQDNYPPPPPTPTYDLSGGTPNVQNQNGEGQASGNSVENQNGGGSGPEAIPPPPPPPPTPDPSPAPEKGPNGPAPANP